MPDEDWVECASPPCSLGELDLPNSDPQPPVSPLSPEQVRSWRKSERERLITQRRAIASGQRERWDARIIAALERTLEQITGTLVSAYWPFRGEPDLRPLFHNLMAKGKRVALPVVVEKGMPLLFREWKPNDRLERGVWNIPYPAEGETVRPDIILAPLVGFDRAGYRLGYGGGFFDRTLAALDTPAYAIGVGYSQAEINTIYPQPHDIPMKIIVTESFVISRFEPAKAASQFLT